MLDTAPPLPEIGPKRPEVSTALKDFLYDISLFMYYDSMPLDNLSSDADIESILEFVVAVFAAIVPSMLLSTPDCGPLENAGAALGALGRVLVDGTDEGVALYDGAAGVVTLFVVSEGATIGPDVCVKVSNELPLGINAPAPPGESFAPTGSGFVGE